MARTGKIQKRMKFVFAWPFAWLTCIKQSFSFTRNMSYQSTLKHQWYTSVIYQLKLHSNFDFKWFLVVQSLSHVRLFSTPWTAASQACLSFTISQSLLTLMFIESVMASKHLALCRPLLLLPLIFSSTRVFSNESALWIRWPNIGASASASVLPMNIQDIFPLGWTGLTSLQSKGPSRVFSSTTVQKHQFFGTQPSLWSNSHIHTWLLEKARFN